MKRSKILTGVLLTTALVSAALPTVSYAEGDFSTTSNGGISTVVSTNSTKFSNYLEEAKTQTEQLKSLIDNGSIDANLLKSISSVIEIADELFCNDVTIQSTDTDISNLRYIWDVYNDTKFDELTVSGTANITATEVENYVNSTKAHVWGILQDSGVNLGNPEFNYSGDDKNLYGSMDNFKRSPYYTKFTDVNESQWFYSEVIESSQLGLFKGNDVGEFNPEGHLTYGEAVTLAARVHATYYNNLKELDDYVNKPYTNHWADNAVAYAEKYGITSTVKGISTLDTPCTREQMADLFVSAIVPYEVNPDSMFISGIFNKLNDMSAAPEQTTSTSIQILFQAGVMIGDDNGFRPTSPITRAETACILNRVTTPSKRKAVAPTTPTTPTTPDTGNSSVIIKPVTPGEGGWTFVMPDIPTNSTTPTTPTTPTTSFSTNIPKDPITGKYIPTNDPAMSAYNRPELVNFIYTTMQDTWSEGSKSNYQALYSVGRSMMADAFGGFVHCGKNMYPNGNARSVFIVSLETFKTLSDSEKHIGAVPRETVENLCAGDFIKIPNWVNAYMLVAERKSNSVIVIEPTVGSSAVFRWREYTFDQLEAKLGDNSAIDHLEFNNLQ